MIVRSLIVSSRLFYIDDSGAESTGYATFSWVEVDFTHWTTGLRSWLDWRKAIAADPEILIPVHYELHATNFLNGRGNPSRLGDSWNRHKANRWALAGDALSVISQLPIASMGTVYRQCKGRPGGYGTQRGEVYAALVAMIDKRLIASGDTGLIVMDGDGTDPTYLPAHRELKLATRALVEDPLFQHSHQSQWVQIADLVAFVTYQHVLQAPNRSYAWSWYPSYLEALHDVGGLTGV